MKDRLSTTTRRGRTHRAVAFVTTVILAAAGASTVAPAHAVSLHPEATSMVASAPTVIDTDDTGRATMEFLNPQSATVGEPRFVTFTVEGNRQAGKTAWIEIYKVNFTTNTKDLVKRFDVVMTAQPQVFDYQVDTSTVDGHMYFIYSDWVDGACGAAGFSYVVMPQVPTTTPPTVPANPTGSTFGGDDDTDQVVAEHTMRLANVPRRFRAGDRVTIRGRVVGPDAANQPVLVTAVSARGGSDMGKTKTDSSGRFKIRTRSLNVGMRNLRVYAYQVNAIEKVRIKVRY